MTFENFNKINDTKLIDLANALIDYEPTKVKNDKYYRRISKNDILETCLKNKSVIQSIKNKSSLALDDYRELLNAVGFMIRDCLTKKFDVYCKRISDSCIGYDYVSENDLSFIEVAMGAYEDKYYWYLESKKDKVLLVKFKYNKKGEIIKFRGKDANIDVTDNRCFQVGKAKIIISDLDKKIYCLSAGREFIYVTKNQENKYKCYGRSA